MAYTLAREDKSNASPHIFNCLPTCIAEQLNLEIVSLFS